MPTYSWLPLLKSLLAAPGLSGAEQSVREIIAPEWEPLVDSIEVSRMGSLHALRRGNVGLPPEDRARPRILIAAHMDAIGLMVQQVVGEFLRIVTVGGVDPRILPGQAVVVHGREALPGRVVMPPPRLLPPKSREGPVELPHLLVDVGLSAPDLAKLVRPGDFISFAQEPFEMTGDTLAGHSLDNRASVAAVTICLRELQTRLHYWDVWMVASVQEEATLLGAKTSAFAIQPDLAVAIDVTFAKGPGANDYQTFGLGKGLTLAVGPAIHSGLLRAFKDAAERIEVPYSLEPMPVNSATDADAMQVVAAGIPTMVMSIPIRYMHTPVEVVALKDIARAGRLLTELVTGLDADFLRALSWDERNE